MILVNIWFTGSIEKLKINPELSIPLENQQVLGSVGFQLVLISVGFPTVLSDTLFKQPSAICPLFHPISRGSTLGPCRQERNTGRKPSSLPRLSCRDGINFPSIGSALNRVGSKLSITSLSYPSYGSSFPWLILWKWDL